MTPARPLAASVAVLAIAGVFTAPAPVTAAPAPCERAERYAAQSGAELLRINQLDFRTGAIATRPARQSIGPKTTGPETASPETASPETASPPNDGRPNNAHRNNGPDRDAARSASFSGTRVAEAKSAFVAETTVNAAAVSRMLNSAAKPKLTAPLIQQAPPTNARPARRDTPAAEAGPLLLDAGALTTHARWAPGMVCGSTHGKVTQSTAAVRAAQVMGIGDEALVAVPEKGESLSTTRLERRGAGARTVAAATIGAQTFELLDGAVKVKMVRPPTLETRMSTLDGGEVRYVPPMLEISGRGIKTANLDAVGDTMEVTLSDNGGRVESGALPTAAELPPGAPLPLPSLPSLPPLDTPEPESAPVTAAGTYVKISLGDARRAARGHSIAARASAIKVVISRHGAADRSKQRYGTPGTALNLEIGVLESAAVAPEPSGGVAGAGAPSREADVSGAGGGLPVTGPRVDLLAMVGVVLLITGSVAMVLGIRRRRVDA